MFQYIGTAISVAALVAALWGGYKWGSHDLDIVKGQLEDVRKTEKMVKQSEDEFRKKLDQELAAQAKAHDTKMAELKERDAKDIADLQVAKGLAEKNAAALRAQASVAATRADSLQKRLQGTVSPQEKTRLQRDLDAANAAKNVALARASGEDCLRLPVPAEIVKSLNLTALP